MIYDPYKDDRVAREAVEEMFGNEYDQYCHFYILRDGVGPRLMGALWESKFAPCKTLLRLTPTQCNKLLGARKFLPRRPRK